MSIQPLKHLNSQKQQLIGKTLRFNSRKASTTSGLLASQNYLNAQKTTTNTNNQQVQGATQDDKQDNNWITWLLAALALIGGIALFAFSRKNGGFGTETTKTEDPATGKKPVEIKIDDEEKIPPPALPVKVSDTLPPELTSLFNEVSISSDKKSFVLTPSDVDKISKVEIKGADGRSTEINLIEGVYSLDIPANVGNRVRFIVTSKDSKTQTFEFRKTRFNNEHTLYIDLVPVERPQQELSLPSESHFTNSSLKQNSDGSFLFSSSFGLTSFQVQKPGETAFNNVLTRKSGAAFTYKLPALEEGQEALVKIKIGDKVHLYKFTNREGVYAFESYIKPEKPEEPPKEPETPVWEILVPVGIPLEFACSGEEGSEQIVRPSRNNTKIYFYDSESKPVPLQDNAIPITQPLTVVDRSTEPYTFFSLIPDPENRRIEVSTLEASQVDAIKQIQIENIKATITRRIEHKEKQFNVANRSQSTNINVTDSCNSVLQGLKAIESESYTLITGETWELSKDKSLVEAVNELRSSVERLIEKENPNTKILEGLSSRIDSLEGVEQFDKATFEQILADIHRLQESLDVLETKGQESSYALVQRLLNIRETKLKAAFAPRLAEITLTVAALENGQIEGEVDLNGLKQELTDHLLSFWSKDVVPGSGKLEPEPIDPTIKSLLDRTNTLINQLKGLADISFDLPNPEKIGLQENIPFLNQSLNSLNNEKALWKLSVSGKDVITTQATSREGKTTYRVLSRQSDNHKIPFAEAGSISCKLTKSTDGNPPTLLITAINIKNAEINPEKFLLAQLLQREVNKDEYPTILVEANLVKTDEALANKLKPYGFVSTEKDGFITLPKAAFDGVWKNWLNNQLALKEIYSNDLSLPSDVPSENITQYVKPDFRPSTIHSVQDSTGWSLIPQDIQVAMNTRYSRFIELSNEVVFSQRQGDENRQGNSTDAAKIRSVLSHEILIRGLELLEKEYRKNPQKIYRENRDNSTPKVFGAAQFKEFQETIYNSTLAALNDLNINGVDFTSDAYTSLLKDSIKESTCFLERVLANNLIGANPEVHFRTIEKGTRFSDDLHEGLNHEYDELTSPKNQPISFTVFPEVYAVSSNGTKQQLIKAKVSISKEDKETQ